MEHGLLIIWFVRLAWLYRLSQQHQGKPLRKRPIIKILTQQISDDSYTVGGKATAVYFGDLHARFSIYSPETLQRRLHRAFQDREAVGHAKAFFEVERWPEYAAELPRWVKA